MNTSTIMGLVDNAALLLALGILYDVMGYRPRGGKPTMQQAVTGVILGAVGIAVMLTPWQFMPGVVFDTRSVLLSVSGLFFGAFPTLLVMLMTSAFRLYNGGAGAWTGVAVIATSGVIGVVWRHLRRRELEDMSVVELYVMGLVVHIAMLLWMFMLPWPLPFSVLSKISLPVMVIFPVGTALLGRLMVNQGAHKRAEEKIKAYAEKLEEMVAERTADLVVAIEEQKSFAYSVSHDLRAPLRGIDGWSLALQEDYSDQLDAQAHEYIDRVRAETQRMGELIDDLLALSRIGRAEMRRETVDLSALAQTIAARLREEEPRRQVEFVIQEGLTTQGDTHLLEIALTNLLDNAWKFSGRRNPARIEFGQTEFEGQPVYFVRDNGVGFDMAYVDKLFGAFQRLHSPAEFPGTGIGLATVQRIIQRHDGRVWAEAEVDKGATFYFTLEAEV